MGSPPPRGDLGSFRIALEDIKADLNTRSNVQAVFEANHNAENGVTGGRVGTDEKHLRGRAAQRRRRDRNGPGALYLWQKHRLTAGVGSKKSGDRSCQSGNQDPVRGDNIRRNRTTTPVAASQCRLRSDTTGLKLGATLSGNAQTGHLASSSPMRAQKAGEYDSVMSRYTWQFQEDSHDLSLSAQKQMGDFFSAAWFTDPRL